MVSCAIRALMMAERRPGSRAEGGLEERREVGRVMRGWDCDCCWEGGGGGGAVEVAIGGWMGGQ